MIEEGYMVNDKKYIVKQQKRIAQLVTSHFKDYYLTGGTALAFYYDHRFSEDLDFFTQKYSDSVPKQIMNFISQKTGFSYKLDAEQGNIDFAGLCASTNFPVCILLKGSHLS